MKSVEVSDEICKIYCRRWLGGVLLINVEGGYPSRITNNLKVDWMGGRGRDVEGRFWVNSVSRRAQIFRGAACNFQG